MSSNRARLKMEELTTTFLQRDSDHGVTSDCGQFSSTYVPTALQSVLSKTLCEFLTVCEPLIDMIIMMHISPHDQAPSPRTSPTI